MKDLTSSVYTFERLIEGNFLYVDKTEYIWNLIRPAGAMYFLSRPRRFGKSLTLSTLKAVFEGKKDLFKGLAIYDKLYDWKKYPVIHLSMNGWNFSTLQDLRTSLLGIIREQAAVLNAAISAEDPVAAFRELLNEIVKNGSVPVLLIDEYDKPLLDNVASPQIQDFFRLMKSFYSVIKDRTGDLRFVFVTGVTKFCHVSLFSDLNNLADISTDAKYATMLGYTQQEFEKYFSDRILETEAKQDLPHTEYLAEIKAWYDGYRFHTNAETVYNPVSIANFFNKDGEFNNYWFSTGTPSFLITLIHKNDMDLRKVTMDPVTDFAFEAFELDNIPPLTLLLQTGYLTIRSAERKYNKTKYYLDFPNREVAESFNTYLLNSYAKKTQNDVASFCDYLSDAMVEEDLPKFQKAMEVFFAGIPYDVHHKNESNFQNIFFCIFKLLGYNISAESRTSDGRIDAVVETDNHIYLFEFKLDHDDSALSQIKEKEYFKPHLLSSKKITLVGVNFDTDTGRLSNWQSEDVK